ncbi:MAG: hypothetical protein U0361_06205 [Nitrospiraceae bacterium]
MQPRSIRPPITFSRRQTVAVVHDDLTEGYRCADWFALRGYQAAVTSADRLVEEELRELRPDVIVLGLPPETPTVPPALLAHLRLVCLEVPIIAMVSATTGMR